MYNYHVCKDVWKPSILDNPMGKHGMQGQQNRAAKQLAICLVSSPQEHGIYLQMMERSVLKWLVFLLFDTSYNPVLLLPLILPWSIYPNYALESKVSYMYNKPHPWFWAQYCSKKVWLIQKFLMLPSLIIVVSIPVMHSMILCSEIGRCFLLCFWNEQ